MLARLGDEPYHDVLRQHREILREQWEAHGGRELGTEGDSFLVVFDKSTDAVVAGVAAQRALRSASWPNGARVRVRMGLHEGTALPSEDGYVGLTVHQAARVAALAHADQILVTGHAAALLEALPSEIAISPLGAHQIRDFAEPVELFQAEHPDLPHRFPPLAASFGHARIAPSLDTFVGRAADLERVCSTLDHSRLVTLTGASGTGKTRLAVEAATAVQTHLRDGAWLVRLDAVSDASLVAPAIRAAVGMDESAGTQLATFLAPKTAVMVLDNCEHVIDEAASVVVDMLQSAPRLRILATSQEPLRVAGETVVPVSPLEAREGVQLFVERATRAGWTDSPDLRAVERIVNLLDGLPLAIELAAARAAVLGPGGIEERLRAEGPLAALGRGSRQAPARHQTLTAAISWSYGLLDEGHRDLLQRLSVTGGAFPVGLAARLAGVRDVTEGLAHLCERSLIAREGGQFRLLESIRAFARARLDESGRTEETNSRLLAWALQQAPDELSSSTAVSDNLRAALHYAFGASRPEAVELVLRLAPAWLSSGRLAEGLDWARRAAGASEPDSANWLYAMWRAGQFESHLMLMEQARSHLEAAVDGLGVVDPLNQASAKRALAGVLRNTGHLVRARQLASEALEVHRQAGVDDLVVDDLLDLGFNALYRGDFHEARHRADAVIGVTGGNAHAYGLHALVSLFEKDHTRALDGADKAVAAAGDNKVALAWALGVLSNARIEAGDVRAAAESTRWQVELSTELGIGMYLADSLKGPAAEIAGRVDELEVAGLLLGGAAGLQTRAGMVTPPAFLANPFEDELRGRLGPDRYDAVVARGAALDQDSLVALTLHLLDSVITGERSV